ncbi:BSP-domain-containing protein [Xylariaceae sp. FL1019]|nr:BSP-domain-containing protein [Xylariaceae sp. FL1019]
MSLPPNTTPAPASIFEPAMSPASAAPPAAEPSQAPPTPEGQTQQPLDTQKPLVAAPKESTFPVPRLRLRIDDITNPGAAIFIDNTKSHLLPRSVAQVQKHLYDQPSTPGLHHPPTRSVTLYVRDFNGVAYTTGKDLDPDHHKEIHLSTKYLTSVSADRRAHEIEGVVLHELVHCYQYNGANAAPGGLIEGLADWVRLQAGLAPPHWHKVDGIKGAWDAGYQHTAYFLQYLEDRFGSGTVRRLNEGLRGRKYETKPFWTGILGRPVEQLWEDYKKSVNNGDAKPTQ